MKRQDTRKTTATREVGVRNKLTYKSSPKRIHVIPQEKKWVIKSEGTAKAARIVSNKDTAILKAKEIAKRTSKDIIVHRKDGTIEDWVKSNK